MSHRLFSTFLLAATLFAAACPQPYGNSRWPRSRTALPRLVFDLHASASFFDTPFPSDARTLLNGAPDWSLLPNPFGVGFVDDARESAQEDVAMNGAGISPLPVVWMRFDSPLPRLQLPPLHTLDDDAPIMLVHLDAPHRGEKIALDVAQTQKADRVRPAWLLQATPLSGLSLRPGRWALIVRTDLDDDGVRDLDHSPDMDALLRGTHDNERWQGALQPLVEALPELHTPVDDIAAATVFRVGDPTALVTRLLDDVRQEPAPEVAELATGPSYDGFVEVRGNVRQAQHQAGEPPHLTQGGQLQLDGRGTLEITRWEDAPFVLSLPKGKMPTEGFPLVFYVHGTGGSATQAVDRGFRERPGAPTTPGSGMAAWLAPKGIATSCMAGPYSPDRIGSRALDGYGAYTFFNPRAMRDNFAQMLIEQTRFLRLLETLRIDPAIAPGVDASAAPDGRIRFNLGRVVVAGHSLGSYLSGMLAGTLDGWRGAVLSGAGGSWVEFAFGPKDPVDLLGLLEGISLPPGEHYDRHHPFISLFEHAVGPADNTFYVRRALRLPRSGHSPPHVLVIEGEPDAQVPTGLQRALVRAVGVDLVGDDVGGTSLVRLLPALHAIGKERLLPPVAGNIVVDTPGVLSSPRTGVVVRYAEDGHLDGHSVLFNRPDTRALFVRFVEDAVAGNVPVVDP